MKDSEFLPILQIMAPGTKLRKTLDDIARAKLGSMKEKPMQGTVVSVGNGKKADDGKVIPMYVKQGDRVLFGKCAGTEIKLDGDEHLILGEDDILGVVK